MPNRPLPVLIPFRRAANGLPPRPMTLFAAALLMVTCGATAFAESGLAVDSGQAHPAVATTPVTGARLTPGPIALPTGAMESITDYGAVGDGVTDDTAAIQAALSSGRSNATANYYGVPKGLYFPPGVYLIRNTLVWNGCCVTLQGAGATSSVIRLAPSAPGFGTPAAPKAIIQTPAGNTSFRQNIWDLGLTVGAGNPGAVAIDYVSNNVGSIRDVNIASEDRGGVAGVLLTRHYPGPLLVKNVAVTGFQYGFETAAYEYGPTFEDITLANQTIAGIYNLQQSISVRNLVSTNAVPAIVNTGGLVLLLDARLNGGATASEAIENVGNLYLRDVASSGYAATLLDGSGAQAQAVKGTIAEYVDGAPLTLRGGAAAASLNLPVSETPSYTDSSLSHWAPYTPSFYGDTKPLQGLLNGTASTIYFPFGAYLAYNEAVITVPDTVKRIVGLSSVVNTSPSGTNGGGIRFVVNSNSTQPLIIEQFGYGIKVEQHGKRPVVLKDGNYSYTSFPGAGSLYLEDVMINQLTIQSGQQVWARQIDTEVTGTKIVNNGSLWVMGLKTENDGTVINTGATGSTEVLGNLIYPARSVASNSVAFLSASQATSYIYSQSSYCASCGYATQVSEVLNGVTLEVTANPSRRYVMSLYHGR